VALKYIDVVVEEHDALPEGCELRFHAVGEAQAVERVLYQPIDGDVAEFTVAGADADDRPVPARRAPVDDSGAGTSILVFGGPRGLRLRRADGSGDVVAEPYLLLAEEAIVR
jgi:hypothetical protein